MPELPGVPLSSGFTNWQPWDASPFKLTSEQQREWQAWLDEVKRARLRAMESADRYVLGSCYFDGDATKSDGAL